MKKSNKQKKQKYFNKILPFVLLIGFFFFYFIYSVSITWDSAHYMMYVNILEGILPFNKWDIVRGPVFPLIIFFSNHIFGKTVQGLLMNSLIYYMIMLFFVYKITINFCEKDKKKNIVAFILMLIIVLNPYIYGFYHTLLTEFVAMTLSILSCYFCYKWINEKNITKRKIFNYLLLFSFLTIYSWFLKQPYISTTIFPIIISTILVLLKRENKKKKISYVITPLVCLLSLFISINLWNTILYKGGMNPNDDRNPTTTLGENFVKGLDCFNILYGKDLSEDDSLNKFLSDKEKESIKNNLLSKDLSYAIIDVKNRKGNVIDREYLNIKGDTISTGEAIKFIISNLFKHPIILADSYLINYLSIMDIYEVHFENNVVPKSSKKINLGYANEISAIGMKPYYYSSNIFSITPEAYDRVKYYEQFNYAPKLLNYFMIILSKISLLFFKILFLVLPFSLIDSIVKRIKSKNSKYDLMIILFGFSFFHLLLHIATGAIIDRYLMPAYIPVLVGNFLMLYNFRSKKNNE